TIIKPVKEKEVEITDVKHLPRKEIPNVVIELEKQMQDAAEGLDFERAIALRDQIKKLTGRMNEAVSRHHKKPGKAGASAPAEESGAQGPGP
ncbi:MAG TPA: UvrB/UvrC motif-containing protein, partial [Methanoregula sp.]|nr:UvrB/UvrC motif-containing protein [Methanoregula sp.]